MAAPPPSIPVPPYPRWTGMRATVRPAPGNHLALVLTVPTLTRRARLWLAWQLLTATGGDHNAPSER